MTTSMPSSRRRHLAAALVAATVGATLSVATSTAPAVAADDRVRPGDGDVVATATTSRLTTRTVTPGRTSARQVGGVRVFPVPSSSAGLRRITTAPDGTMWFVEEDTNTIGRITPSGSITELTLPEQTTSGSRVNDLDVAPDGDVWVAWDSGWKLSRVDVATLTAFTWEFTYPYAEEVRVQADGVAWATMSYDEDGIVRVQGNQASWHPNAPECDDALGAGTDGRVWCRQLDRLVRVNPLGDGGVTYPLPSNATYPYSIAPGAGGDVWFARDTGGTMFTSPRDGNVGWISAASGAVRTIELGDAVAPRSLRRGPDGAMWFTSVGRTQAIGWVTPSRTGSVVKIGSYRPTSLTFSRDGAVWFTDRSSNVIVRVPRTALRYTNTPLGDGTALVAPRAPRAATLKVRRAGAKRVFTGTVGSPAAACRSGVVTLYRTKPGRPAKVGTARAVRGSWRIARPARKLKKGRYYASVRPTRSALSTCAGVTTPKRRL
ncbi:hypothetical protein ABFT23_19230 [Nocardioides sp. C4-1]|uniref:Vgb family protein n=1 Tax=Nocardioides sp. C4-1 TaxID=3151851 RepID=UPI003266D6FC